MKHLYFLFLSLLATATWAQNPAGAPAAPAAAFRAPLRSPEMMPDGKVTFRLRSPNAKQVMLAIEGVSRDSMKKDDQGVWSLTRALDSDIYDYAFQVDGLQIPDPANPVTKPAYQGATQSLAHVPGPSSLSWEVRDSPHGVVNRHYYKSTIIGDQRDFYVYLPPNYDPNRKEPYPVLYLLHGLGGNALSWIDNGAANVILDNLINEGKAKPMIMVNTLGYGDPANVGSGAAFEKFTQALIKEVIPQVEKTYRASKDRNQRAIAGLSMGGAETYFAGLNNLDQFSYIGGFSSALVMYGGGNRGGARPAAGAPGTAPAAPAPAPSMDDTFAKIFPTLDAKANAKINLLYITCGTEDGLIAGSKDLDKWLTSKGVKHTYTDTPGAHTFFVWRRNLTTFAPMLFQVKAK